MYVVGRHQPWWRQRRRRWRGCEQNAVRPGADVGEKGRKKGGKTERGLLDVFSDGLHLKSGAFTFCSPLLLKIPTSPLHLSLCRFCLSSTSISRKRIQQSLKCSRDGSRLTNAACAIAVGTVDRSFLFSPLCILVCRLSSQVIFVVLPVHERIRAATVRSLHISVDGRCGGKTGTGAEADM